MRSELRIREADEADALEIAKIHVDCWRTTYKNIVPDEKLDGLSYGNSEAKWKDFFTQKTDSLHKILLCSINGQPAGFCAGGLKRKNSKRTEGYDGEIKAIYILKQHQKKGAGKKLLESFEEIFTKNGIYSYIIWVLKENDSKNFYKKLGGKLITTKIYEIGGKKLKGLCYGFKIKKEDS
jgi:ribosomal protein S18 acetylase RimI-like enzyme